MTHDFEKTLRYLRGYFKKRSELFRAINEYVMPDDVGKFDTYSLDRVAEGKINVGFCHPIELVTKGEITRHMLRPDWFEKDGTVKKPNLKQYIEPQIPKTAEA